MPNALTAHSAAQHRILALGDIGSGKTTQIITLPGRKFAYLFDPNALRSLQGHDVDYEEVLTTTVSAAVSSLSKGKTPDRKRTNSSEVYQKWNDEIEERIENGFFDEYDWICFDSATTLLSLIMDRVLTLNNRFGSWPSQDDWGPQMEAFTNFVRTVCGMGKNIYITGHMHDKENRQKGTTKRVPMLTGRLVNTIPLLFSDILGFESTNDKDDKGKVQIGYQCLTVRDFDFPVIRCSMKGLAPVEDVTINFTKPVVGQGLGGIIQWSADNPLG